MFKHLRKLNKNEEILLYLVDNNPIGWIQWYYLDDENLVTTMTFLAKEKYKQMLEEFIEYVSIGIGVPYENEQACEALDNNGFKIEESSFVTILRINKYKDTRISNTTINITEENYHLFKKLHDAIDIYWNSKRIFEAMDDWNIFYYENKMNNGVIYSRKVRNIDEVFGVDYSVNTYDYEISKVLFDTLIKDLSKKNREFLYYFTQDETEKNDLIKLGFDYLDRYCYFYRK